MIDFAIFDRETGDVISAGSAPEDGLPQVKDNLIIVVLSEAFNPLVQVFNQKTGDIEPRIQTAEEQRREQARQAAPVTFSAWPVDSVFLSVSNVNPAKRVGFGTWDLLPNRLNNLYLFKRVK